MCKVEFEMMALPSKKAKYNELFQEIKVIGKGAFGSACLVKSRNKHEFYIAKKIKFKRDE